MKIRKLLVANRGEIAIRVLRAASELRIRTVALYTYEDRYSLHRYKADEAYQIGADDDPLRPYLDIEEIILQAKIHKVDAIHPGYGFLSENVTFARRCREEGIIFVGPDPEVMEQLGDKVRAKAVAQAVQVPIIESNQVPLVDVPTAHSEARRIGYPVILKAAAGGGGRGMRVLHTEDQLERAFTEARREAKNAFGDDTIFLEKYIVNPKHIEVQILGDRHGNIYHLYERDCSVQRRFQKVVEVAPAPGLQPETKQKLYDYALAIARHVNYNNAGTVEFLVDENEDIYFIEVNPRVQVEHTVTEEVTGIDIVRSQIIIAAGRPMSSSGLYFKSQEDITCDGFAIQCRITTEDPENKFKPDYGTILFYRNAGGFGIRIDEGSSYTGVRISPFFDSMLAKVTASGRTLKGACQRLHRTLTEFRIRGVKTNIPFLENVIMHPEFQEGKARVSFIDTHPELFDFSRKQDRGTRILRFLADTTVNGNPIVKNVDPSRKFRTPRIPAFDRFAEYPAGTKQRLQELGREGFTQWLRQEKEVKFTDTTFRDAHQSLLATRMRTRDLLAVAESFAKNHPQVFSAEVWGGATFDVAMRFLREDPWQRLQLFREAMPNLLLQMLLRGSNAVGYTAYPDNLVEKFIEKSAEQGIDIFRIFDSLNWLENMKVSIRTVRERTESLAEVCLCYTGDISDPSRTKYTLQYYLDLARQVEDEGAHLIAIKDMAGLLKPYAATQLITELKKAVDVPIHLHTHDSSSAQLATYMKAIEAGVDVVDIAIGSMSGLTSQPNFNTLVETLKTSPRAPQFDIDSLNDFSDYWEVIREYYYPFESGLKAGAADVYQHEIPGGQYSNLRSQATALGLANKMPEIRRMYAAVNQMFGDIVKVTPSSKVVGDMALYMVSNNLTPEDVYERGEQLSFPDSVQSFFRGELGQPVGGFPEKLQQIVLKGEPAFTDRPNAHLQPIEFEQEFEEFRKQFDSSLTLLDFLSWKLYPTVFEEYFAHHKKFGDISNVPTLLFLYGMNLNEEAIIEIDSGKSIIVQLQYISEPDERGMRTVNFILNGQSRSIDTKDRSVKVDKAEHVKVKKENEIGTPLQGMLSRILVKPGTEVQKNTPLFIVEAMKMETTITAPREGTVGHIELSEGTLVDTDDLVLTLD
ncbi:pyruvate carboxylase [Catalinimonas alkaloidigena]|uniref:Pyruvate carboxylase n=1 Tax=Catalinimonas alkaloidigena TaxID=1075417 RepID=A0A1G9K711_9BACT|nr:pyruvate carboxylase [Catalinimonas alkaloidigena]SDL45214.1 pyruvate carboxylase [Catalinimonas alkaloidigena]